MNFINDLNGEKTKGRFYGKELLLSMIWMSHYPAPNSHIREKVKVVLDLLNCTTK